MRTTPPAPAPRTRLRPPAVRAPRRRGTALASLLDGVLECAVLAFAWWTLLDHLALLASLPATLTWWVWLVGSAALVAVRVLLQRRVGRLGAPGRGHGWAALVALGMAALSAVVVRPDLDDASYTVRSAWVASRGVLDGGDVIFSDGRWPGLPEQTPYLPSFENLLGATAGTTGLSAGALVYAVYVPLATAAAVWALWTLVREWRVRRPVAVLVLACVLLLWGATEHASWANLHLGRIWQGKVTLLAVLVPLTYAWCARYWASRRGASRASALVLVASAGVAAVGLSPAGIFVVPGVVVVASVVGLLTRRARRAALLVATGCAYPLLAGLVMATAGRTDDAIPASTAAGPWERTLGSGPVAWVVLAAGLAALVALYPPAARARSVVATATAAASVVVGLVLALPPVTDLLAVVMGTDAIVWRVVWVVPVPLLVGMLAAPTRRGPRPAATVVGLAAALTLVVGGQAVWSAQNGAVLAAPGTWKVHADDLVTARWVVAHAPAGRYLAREGVVAAVGTTTADLAPVGSRPGYIEPYLELPEALAADRLLLQAWVDGARELTGTEAAEALATLDVRLVCGRPAMGDVLGDRWAAVWSGGPDTCWDLVPS
jgi:hypothetical protein